MRLHLDLSEAAATMVLLKGPVYHELRPLLDVAAKGGTLNLEAPGKKLKRGVAGVPSLLGVGQCPRIPNSRPAVACIDIAGHPGERRHGSADTPGRSLRGPFQKLRPPSRVLFLGVGGPPKYPEQWPSDTFFWHKGHCLVNTPL